MLRKILLIGVLTGCGSGHSDGSQSPSGPTPSGPAAGSPAGVAPGQTGADLPPLETYLTSPSSIPARLNASTLVVTFRSNDAQAIFQCLPDNAAAYAPCPLGASYDFGPLVSGRSYGLKVRAANGGRIDPTPLAVAFLVDRIHGDAPGQASSAPASGPTAGARVPTQVSDLPAAGGGGNRVLQVGSYYALIVPAADEVTSYATTKTTNGLMLSLRLINSPLTTIEQGLACTEIYDKVVPGPNGASYCDSTPTEEQWTAASPTPAPKNHAEIVHTTTPSTFDEKVLVAAFDADADPSEAHLGLGQSCQGAFYSGTSAVTGLNTFYGLPSAEASFSWCQVRDSSGTYWWLGTFAAALGGTAAPAGAPRLRVVYAAAANLGLFSGSQFAERAAQVLPALIQPIAPP